MLWEGERVHSGETRDGLRYGDESAKDPRERTQRRKKIKASRCGYNEGKNQVTISKVSKYFAEDLKSKSRWNC